MAQAKADKAYTYLRKVNQELLDLILADIERGAPIKYAAESHKLSEAHFHNLVNQGLVDINIGKLDTIQANLVESLRNIHKEKIIKYQNEIKDSPKGHLGAQWMLERVFWKQFSANAAAIENAEQIEQLRIELKQNGVLNNGEADGEKA
jgi:hypothetical protein